jgi:hypothetical protein
MVSFLGLLEMLWFECVATKVELARLIDGSMRSRAGVSKTYIQWRCALVPALT